MVEGIPRAKAKCLEVMNGKRRIELDPVQAARLPEQNAAIKSSGVSSGAALTRERGAATVRRAAFHTLIYRRNRVGSLIAARKESAMPKPSMPPHAGWISKAW